MFNFQHFTSGSELDSESDSGSRLSLQTYTGVEEGLARLCGSQILGFTALVTRAALS